MLPIELANADIRNLTLIRSTMQLQQELNHLRLKLVSKRLRVVLTPQSLLLQLLLQAPPDDDDEERNDELDDDDAQDDDDQEDKGDDNEDQEEGNYDEQASDEEGEEFIHPSLSTHDEKETRNKETFDPIPKTPKNTNDEGNGEENLGMNATATVHHHSIRFKMDKKKHIVNLEYFREMLHICPRIPCQTFDEPPFEDEILAFFQSIGHSGEIRRLTDVEHKDTKKSNEMYYPRFTKVIIHHFMFKDPSIPRRNKVNWYYVIDYQMFMTIKLVSRHQNTQQFGAMLPIELANADIRNLTLIRSTMQLQQELNHLRLKLVSKRLRVVLTPQSLLLQLLLQAPPDDDDDAQDDDDQEDKGDDNEDQEEGNYDEQASDEEGEEFIHPSLSTHDEKETRNKETFDPIPKTPKNTNDEGNGRGVQMADVHTTQEFEDSHVTLTPVNPDGRQQSSSVSSQFVTSSNLSGPLSVSAPTLTLSTIATVTIVQQAPTPPTTAPSTLLQDLPNFGSLFRFDHRLKTLEANFFKFMQTNQFAGASDRLCDEAQAKYEEFLKTIDENMKKIIKEQVKEQVKVQVFKILPKIKQTVNEQLEAEVLTQSSNSSKTSYALAADLSEMELKKILIEKIEGNKSIHRSNEQRNLYKALVEAYESDKIILDTYGDTIILKRRRYDDVDEEPSAGSDWGSKRRREGNEPDESATADEPMRTTHEMKEPLHPKFETGADDQPIAESSQHPEWFSQQKKPSTLNRDWNKTLSATHRSIQTWISKLAKQTDSCSSFNELMDTPQYPHNLLKPLPLIPKSQGRRVIPFNHFINNDLEYLREGTSSHKYTTSVTKTNATDYGHIKWIEDLVPRTIWIQEPIMVRRDDDKLYKFKEGDFKRLRIQDIKDMLLLLVQGKLTNLTVEERIAFNVSLRIFTRRIIIQRNVEDLQLSIESYQKKLNLTRSDTYHSDLKRKEDYIAYSNPRGFIHQNKDKQNRLMRIDELHKFSDGTLTDVRTTLDDCLKGIRMKYLPQTIWRKSDKEKTTTMIQAIDTQLKIRRIMRSLERFVGGRQYEGDFKMLQRTI
uniref:Uncharacterized protein n=1 Tax=Tanacetum cinerariifolium TaxID=118510 RepID=A0A699IBJ6_TANCI|nr:hypothetical protein [Tanacetum cinerariifolium]